jgi:hypothetical protein
MSIKSEIMDQFEATGLTRKVIERPVFMFPEAGERDVNSGRFKKQEGILIEDRKALVFEDDDTYISTVGAGYQVIQNEDVFSSLTDGLISSGLNLEGLEVIAHGTNDARNMAMINLPNHAIFEGTPDETYMQIVARNSHNSSWKQSIDVGGFRIACTNGQVAGNIVPVYSNRHTASYEIERLSEYFDKSIDGFDKMGALWVRMQKTVITDVDAYAMILKYLNKTAAAELMISENVVLIEQFENQKRFKEVVTLWNKYKDIMGSNLYALYNAFTDDASHVDSKKMAQAITDRQAKIIPALTHKLAA